jgi:hypothetical protein
MSPDLPGGAAGERAGCRKLLARLARHSKWCRNLVAGTALFCGSCLSPTVTAIHSHSGIAASALDRTYGAGQFDHAADGVVGQCPVEGFDEFGGGEVADLVPASTAATPRATRTWLLPVPAGLACDSGQRLMTGEPPGNSGVR